MSESSTAHKTALPARRDRRSQFIGGSGLVSIAVGTAMLDGWLPVVVALATAAVWWRVSTPLALTTLTVGLVAVVPPTAPLVQFGTTIGALLSLGTPLAALAVGTALLTIGSWLSAGTTPTLASGWTLLPLGIGWLCVAGAVLADTPLWVILVVSGGLTLLAANAISQLTDHRQSLSTTTAEQNPTDQ